MIEQVLKFLVQFRAAEIARWNPFLRMKSTQKRQNTYQRVPSVKTRVFVKWARR